MFKGVMIAGLGGFCGTVSRYLLSQFIQFIFKTSFPLGTLSINLIGCFLIGIFYGLFDRGSILSPELRLFLTVGFCGGFTTFSTFSNDTVNLANDAELIKMMFYLGVSIIAGISMTVLGKNLVQYIWS